MASGCLRRSWASANFEIDTTKRYLESDDGFARLHIAKQEDNPFTLEDTLKWSAERVDLYTIGEQVYAEWEKEKREEAEERAKYGERPDDLTEEEWDMLDGAVKKRVSEGRVDDTALRNHIERLKQKQEEDT
ncbi:hypothetical protein [Saliphagus sp. LR7]|uniref:hypothetical protein n=1 Tax=Saliphagus sp. LR7 TaxID=2282654 RepID=UPI0018E4EB57|nr:hypothetical protein [Saliphagus sp. LR7]